MQTSDLRKDGKVHEMLATTTDESEQLDAIAKMRGWYFSHSSAADAVKAYMARQQDVETTVNQLAKPIEHLYTTADDGRALREAELVAKNQRQYCSAEEAEERWGLPQEFPEEEDAGGEFVWKDSAEGLLGQLWFGILHNARKTPWHDEEAQNRLIDLVRSFKQRPDPPPPVDMTKALKADWIWSSGHVWSDLSQLGPSAREHWNDSPGGGGGWTAIEVRSWLNVNAFVARLTITGLFDFWAYGMWALRDGLESDPRGDDCVSGAEKLGFEISVVNVWMRTAGAQFWEAVLEKNEQQYQDIDPETPFKELPWKPQDYQKQHITWTRWVYWKARLRLLCIRKTLTDEARQIAAALADLMEDIEQSHHSEDKP